MNAQMQMLAEAYDYKGVFFEENYTYSYLLKAFYEDVNRYGAESAEEMYVNLFGEETEELFSYINENFEYLEEAVSINSEILFEGYADIYLKEAGDGVSGFLKGVWDKIKGLGTGALSKLKDFVGKGIPWAKEIAQKGASFFAGNPIAQVAIPAVALAGGVAAGWKLLSKMKKKKLSAEEKEKFKETVEQNKDKVKKYA